MRSDPYTAARDSAAVLAERTGRSVHDVAVVLGSGWGPAAAAFGDPVARVPLTDLGGFPDPTVPGHAGQVLSATVGGHAVLVFLGRVHLYEGHSGSTVVHGVRTAAAAGCRTVVLTNAAGAVNRSYSVGQPVLIADHLNLTGVSPLTGPPPPDGYPPRFVDLTDLYSSRLRAAARQEAPGLAEGIYASLRGPHYETPSEVAMLAGLGADLVGMSTALEAIAARHLGLEVLGLSLVTNLAAGLGRDGVSHEEVLVASAASAASIGELVAKLLTRL